MEAVAAHVDAALGHGGEVLEGRKRLGEGPLQLQAAQVSARTAKVMSVTRESPL